MDKKENFPGALIPVLDAIDLPVMILEANSRVVVANLAMLNWLDMPEEIVEGYLLAEIATPGTRAALLKDALRELRENRHGMSGKLVSLREDQTYWVQFTAIDANISDGKAALVSVRSAELTGEKRIGNRNLLAYLSHQIKTPVSSIHVGLEMLGKGTLGPLNEHQQEILADIERQLSRLLRFVNELQIPESRRSQVRERRQINLKNHPRLFRQGNSGSET
ncbi:MAG: PAS domain-containing protein [Calditrichaeota bacterium]|nr:PAS domain-containing protein [Calditrichota bacterium]